MSIVWVGMGMEVPERMLSLDAFVGAALGNANSINICHIRHDSPSSRVHPKWFR